MYARLARLEFGTEALKQKVGAASELAADAALWAREARSVAAQSVRQNSKVTRLKHQTRRSIMP